MLDDEVSRVVLRAAVVGRTDSGCCIRVASDRPSGTAHCAAGGGEFRFAVVPRLLVVRFPKSEDGHLFDPLSLVSGVSSLDSKAGHQREKTVGMTVRLYTIKSKRFACNVDCRTLPPPESLP